MNIATISVLGSGWLGLPLVQHFRLKGYHVKASTTTQSRLSELVVAEAEPFQINIDSLTDNIQGFLQAHILIINITSKNSQGFGELIKQIQKSAIQKVLFVSSTSVYQNHNKTIFEADNLESAASPLVTIENLFRNNARFKTTIVRFGGLIGYTRHPGNFFKKGKVVADPDARVNLIHRDDCIQIISQIIEQEAWGEIFNCCADTHPTKREFYKHAAESIGKPAPNFSNSDQKSFKIISNQKVKKFLDYEFLHPDVMKIQF